MLRIECYDRKRWSYGTLVRTLPQSQSWTVLRSRMLCGIYSDSGVLYQPIVAPALYICNLAINPLSGLT